MHALKFIVLLLCTFTPSPVRLAVWRLLGFKVGRGCRVAMFSVVVADTIEIGPGAIIETLTLVYRPTFFSMGERSRVAGFVRIIGYRGRVSIGPQTFIALGCLIDSTGDFELGSRSAIGPRSLLYSHGASGLIFNVRYPHRIGPVRIGEDSWIGMGCIVCPLVTVGDRVIVLPGTVVRADVPNDTSLVAPATEHRTVSTSRLLLSVTDEVRRREMDNVLRKFAESVPGARLDDSRSDLWRLSLPRKKTIYLLRTDAAALDSVKLSSSDSVVWTLFQRDITGGIPTFCFDRLTVFNRWTPFAERVADWLCVEEGAQFRFQEGIPGTPRISGRDG